MPSSAKVKNGPVAQLDRALVFGTKGWGFESLRGRQSVSEIALTSSQLWMSTLP